MTGKNIVKINQLLQATPHSAVLTTSWLKKHAISHKLAWWYVKSGWLERIAGGAYCFANQKPSWIDAVSALQSQLSLSIHPGGKTALQLLGKTHYAHQELKTIQLFAPRKTKLPKWLHASYWNTSFALSCSNLFSENFSDGLVTLDVNGTPLLVSSPERAALELCHSVPKSSTFGEAALIIENLSRMRPSLMQKLLELSQSYKAKRLLLYLADYYQHPWVSSIDMNRVDLGKGKRVIAGGGYYSSTYQLSVPHLERK